MRLTRPWIWLSHLAQELSAAARSLNSTLRLMKWRACLSSHWSTSTLECTTRAMNAGIVKRERTRSRSDFRRMGPIGRIGPMFLLAALDLVPIRQGFIHSHLIDVLQITSNRHAHGYSGDLKAQRF